MNDYICGGKSENKIDPYKITDKDWNHIYQQSKIVILLLFGTGICFELFKIIVLLGKILEAVK